MLSFSFSGKVVAVCILQVVVTFAQCFFTGKLCQIDESQNYTPSTGSQLERAKKKGYLDEDGRRKANQYRKKRRKIKKIEKNKAKQEMMENKDLQGEVQEVK